MADPVTCTGFLPNPSVFGIGERVGFYVIGVLAAVAPIKSSYSPSECHEIKQGNQEVEPQRELSSVVTAQSIVGLAWLITALIQTAEKKLSLYHALLIISLLFLLSTSFLYYLWNPRRIIEYRWIFLLCLLLLAGFSLYVGLTARTFGSQPECNDTVKIIWIPHVKTASFAWFRGFGIVVCGIYAVVCIAQILQIIHIKQSKRVNPKYLRSYCIFVLIANFILIGIIERTIHINKVHTESIWSFGQTFSIVMTIKPLIDTWRGVSPWIKAKWLKHRAARNTLSSRPPSYISQLSYDLSNRSGYIAVEK